MGNARIIRVFLHLVSLRGGRTTPDVAIPTPAKDFVPVLRGLCPRSEGICPPACLSSPVIALSVSSGSDSHRPEKPPIKYPAELSRALLKCVGIQLKV